MPYRNVYEEKNKRISGVKQNDEPEKDPKKIAEIYRQQMPNEYEIESTKAKLRKHEERLERARGFSRGI